MKVKTEPNFTPVTIILETQEEVDKLFALINHGKIDKAVPTEDWYMLLDPFKSSRYRNYHNALDLILKDL